MFQTILVAALVAGQAAKPAVPPIPPPPRMPEAAKQKEQLAEVVARALQTHPDIRVAEAEVQMAQAKLAQAKMKVAQQVTAAQTEIDRFNVALQSIDQQYAALIKMGDAVSATERFNAESTRAAARANLAKAAAEYNALVVPPQPTAVWVDWQGAARLEGGGRVAFSADGSFHAVQAADGTVRVFPANPGGPSPNVLIPPPPPVVPGSPAEKLQAALDKPVKLPGATAVSVKTGYEAILKSAGLELHLRVPMLEEARPQMTFSLPAGEYPLGTWFELIADVYAQAASGTANDRIPKRYELYLREYGLLLSEPKLAPPGAITVSDLWKQVRAEKAAEKKK